MDSIKRSVLIDALHEFIGARQGDYVDRRYAHMSESFRKTKRAEVAERCAAAAAMLRQVQEIP